MGFKNILKRVRYSCSCRELPGYLHVWISLKFT